MVEELVILFYNKLFENIFANSFLTMISKPLKQREVSRRIGEYADAASQSLTRFFQNQKLQEKEASQLLSQMEGMHNHIQVADLVNPNVPPEHLVERILLHHPCPDKLASSQYIAIYRESVHSIVQTLMLIGPLMQEWKKLNFVSDYEPLRSVVRQLNRISEQLGNFTNFNSLGVSASDEQFELQYRDRVLQRFYRVEAGTVRMTTNQNVDLRVLFVQPRVLPRPKSSKEKTGGTEGSLMNLGTARELFAQHAGGWEFPVKSIRQKPPFALEQIKKGTRNIIIGSPGSGKSTFLEWLNLQLAAGEEELLLGGGQAIPVLLRVRQLNTFHLPSEPALLASATSSSDLAALMPSGWLDRQMIAGRVLFILDGLDELDPDQRDGRLLPWLENICKYYTKCHYLISSRPVGYPPGSLSKLGFSENDLLDFDVDQVGEYSRHWCTAVRLAQNEPEAEARREGAAEGDRIVAGFRTHPYIRDLARNPLMLSAICLVNYFERGKLPEDRALLYRLCVEGLLHHWDQRRGIHSEFGLEEKLRACREVAIAMQSADQAEMIAENVQQIFSTVFENTDRARRLLEHIRYRTGLLLERRPGIFAFAHLTFQEYLAARAVHEGNRLGVTWEQLVETHSDQRWREVIALYCGLVPKLSARKVLEHLLNIEIEARASAELAQVIGDAYLASGAELAEDQLLRKQIMERIATSGRSDLLGRFEPSEALSIANDKIGTTKQDIVTGAYDYLLNSPGHIAWDELKRKLWNWRNISAFAIAELVHLLHICGPSEYIEELHNEHIDLYCSPGPIFDSGNDLHNKFYLQSEVALLGLEERTRAPIKPKPISLAVAERAITAILESFVKSNKPSYYSCLFGNSYSNRQKYLTDTCRTISVPAKLKIAAMVQTLLKEGKKMPEERLPARDSTSSHKFLNNWAKELVSRAATKKPSKKKR